MGKKNLHWLVSRTTRRETANRPQRYLRVRSRHQANYRRSLASPFQDFGSEASDFFGFEDNERPVGRDEALLTLPDQGLRLHRAFIGVKNPALREAIVSLVIELARNETST
jgi:hypothetical protein